MKRMKITALEMKNFGIYRGFYRFDFLCKENRNVILILGRNGAGKSTILEALQLSIYGPLYLGYQTYNDQYYSYIRTKLNLYALAEGEDEFFVKIEFLMVEEGKCIQYEIKRKWEIKEGRLTEKLSIKKDSEDLNEIERINFMNYIHTFMPPQLYRMFFFDGEKMNEFFLVEDLQEKLNDMFEIVFNIDIYKALKNDLIRYLKQKTTYSQLDENERRYADLVQQKNELEEKKKVVSEEILALKGELNGKREELEKLKEEFKTFGGLTEREVKKYYKRMAELQLEKERITEEFKQKVNEFLPFIILKEEIQELIQEILYEQKVKDALTVVESLSNPALISEMVQNVDVEEEMAKKVIDFIKEKFSVPYRQEFKYNLSKEDKDLIFEVARKIQQIDSNFVKEYFEKVNELNKKIYELNKTIQANKNGQFEDYIERIDRMSSLISDIEKILLSKKEAYQKIESDLEEVERELDRLQDKIVAVKKDQNIVQIVSRLNRVIEEYISSIKKIKLKELERHMTYIFKKILRKQNFVERISLSDENGGFKVYTAEGEEIRCDMLSAGERQVFVLSFLWGLIKLSGREVPVFFDTLFARLDMVHRKNILRDFIPVCSDQVIMLVTDTELQEEDMMLIKDSIGKVYKIEFDAQKKNVCLVG